MVTINKGSSKPYYEQLILSIKEEILRGILKPGDRLPSVREMAKQILMNPNTVAKAYKVLESEQVIVTVQGKGAFVKKQTDTARDEARVSQLKEQTNQLVIEAYHLKVSKQELIDWIKAAEEGSHSSEN